MPPLPTHTNKAQIAEFYACLALAFTDLNEANACRNLEHKIPSFAQAPA